MSGQRQLILASASPRRRELLGKLGLQFTVQPADIDEQVPDEITDLEETARELARQKAEAVVSRWPDAVVLAADTIVTVDGKQLGKPSAADEARAMLTSLRSRRHTVITGVATGRDGTIALGHASTGVLMRDYGEDEIASTIEAGTPFDKAGGYAIQDQAFHPVARFEGCYCNVVGLPLATTIDLLQQAGFTVPVTEPSQLLPQCSGCALF